MSDDKTKTKKLQLGLGEAILRLVHVEVIYANGYGITDELVAERKMIVQALNQYNLDLGFDCNDDGMPDDVSIFEQSASTSCCRITPIDTSRKRTTAPASPRKRG